MKKILKTFSSLLLGLSIAVGVAQASATLSYDSGDIASFDYTLEKPTGGTNPGTCGGGVAPRCYRPECPSTTVCPAKDQCSGGASCFLITRYDGATNCSVSGSCVSSTGNVVMY